MAQKALFPMKYLNVTQGYGVGSHRGSYALDLGGRDTGIDNVYAPFDCVVKKIWKNSHVVWVESVSKVQCADGTVSKLTMSLTHDNSVANLHVGQKIRQGQVFYQEGTYGLAYGNHVHLELAKGSFVGTGWYLNYFGGWTIWNKVKPETKLFLKQDTVVRNSGGLKWTRLPKPVANYKVATVLRLTNVRVKPTTVNSKVVGQVRKGTKLKYVQQVKGQRVSQNGVTTNVWLRRTDGKYVWRGNMKV